MFLCRINVWWEAKVEKIASILVFSGYYIFVVRVIVMKPWYPSTEEGKTKTKKSELWSKDMDDLYIWCLMHGVSLYFNKVVHWTWHRSVVSVSTTLYHELCRIFFIFLPIITILHCPPSWTKCLLPLDGFKKTCNCLWTWEMMGICEWLIDWIVMLPMLIVMSCWWPYSHLLTHKRSTKHTKQQPPALWSLFLMMRDGKYQFLSLFDVHLLGS